MGSLYEMLSVDLQISEFRRRNCRGRVRRAACNDPDCHHSWCHVGRWGREPVVDRYLGRRNELHILSA